MGSPYYYGYSMQAAAPRGTFSTPQPHRIQAGPSYLYYPTTMEGGSFSAAYRPLQQPFSSSIFFFQSNPFFYSLSTHSSPSPYLSVSRPPTPQITQNLKSFSHFWILYRSKNMQKNMKLVTESENRNNVE
jgi:hypothetical protein